MVVGVFGLAALGVFQALAALGRGLLLAVYAGRLVVLAPAGFGQDAGLLHHLVEPLQRLVEAFVAADIDLRQTVFLLVAIGMWAAPSTAGIEPYDRLSPKTVSRQKCP